MADDTLERGEKQEVSTSPKQLRCRFHETEEYTIFCKDCKDFMCFKCIGQLHQKHELSQLQDADKAIRTEMCVLLFEKKHLSSLSDKVSDKEKELVKDEESLTREIRKSVDKMKQNIDLAEKRLLSELRNEFNSYQISLHEQKTNIQNLQTEMANLKVDKLHQYNLDHVIYCLSEMKLCSSTCDKCINHPKPGFQPIMEFSIGNSIQTSSGKLNPVELSLSTCSNISTQTDFLEDSDSEWFDAEDKEEDDVIESSSDEIKDEYPIKFKMNQDIKIISKIVPISEKNAWIISNRKLRKIVDHSLQGDAYAETVDDIVVLKDGCVLVLNYNGTFIMKLLPNKRLVRFADIGSYSPHCVCIKDDIIVIYSSYVTGNNLYNYISKSHITWLNTDGIVIKISLFSNGVWKRPCSIHSLESGLCVLYRVNANHNLHSIELLEPKSDKCDKLFAFNGIYGLNPQKNFECGGMCADKAGNMFVSDYRHHSVYVLDKNMKYKKTLFDARNGLDKPAAIGMFNNHLWVADENQIFIFNYECAGNN